MKKVTAKMIAKSILMKNLAISYYRLYDDYDYDSLTDDEKELVNHYIDKYATAMAKAIKKEYFTL